MNNAKIYIQIELFSTIFVKYIYIKTYKNEFYNKGLFHIFTN